MKNQENSPHSVACYGEILWDATPHGLFLGGAPFNVAYHLTRLGQPSLVISAIGRDELGRQAIRKAEAYEMDISCIQIRDTMPTGISDITIDESGDATYDIRQPAAWDNISYSELLSEKLLHCPALVYGTLSSRASGSRGTLRQILKDYQGLTVCDINLRKPHDKLDLVLDLARKAQIIKLNEDELYTLCDAKRSSLSFEEALVELKKRTSASMIFVTRGGEPAVYFDGDRTVYANPPKTGKVVDTIGAGDAFTAALVFNLLKNVEMENCLEIAVRLGSFVASKHGAQPDYDPVELETKAGILI